ncbi:protein adenylyltransferase SelO [Hwanghaeella sp.]|uniref:protein adenylyltransferase SelO n=1 Tax=Hwanghaeella sp. TaxID=2605943 RepID=UPI003CCBE5E1
MPVSPAYRADIRHPTLGDAFYDPVQPADFPKHILRFRNDRWAERVGLDTLTDAEWIRHFGRFEPLPDNLKNPLALRYHGHQFRTYNPDLGDGRGFLFAQMRDRSDGRLLDLGTKGSGQTPWSRQGDGRLTLKGGVREILATEMLEALGVNTSKTFSVIETGEALYRDDEPSPTRAAVLVRLSHGHIRFGTFQRLLVTGQAAEKRALVDYVIQTYWPEAADSPDPVIALFDAVMRALAKKGAQWFAAGFVHGVLNTDNMAITGESFDYGPWRFLPNLDPGFTAAYFDSAGLYSFGRQPEALHWNLARLAECLLDLAPQESFEEAIGRFGQLFEDELVLQTHWRLGLMPDDPDKAQELTRAFYAALRESGTPYEQAFFDLAHGADPARLSHSHGAEFYRKDCFAEALDLIREAPRAAASIEHAYFKDVRPVTMLVEDVEAIWSAIDKDDDWSPLHRKVQEIRTMGDAYAALPRPMAG